MGDFQETDFPGMSDLQVAALAAAGKTIADVGADDGGASSGDEESSSGEESSSEEESSSGEESSSDEEEEEEEEVEDAKVSSTEAAAPAATTELAENGGSPERTAPEGDTGALPETAVDSDDDSSDWRSESSDDVNFPGTEAIKKIIDKAGDTDEEEIVSKNEVKDLPPPEPIDVEISPDDKVDPCGTVSAVLDGQVVIQAPVNSNILAEGSIVVLADRTPIGRVEEVFGPVQAPLYLVRYAGKLGEGSEPRIAPATELFAVSKHSDYMATDMLYVKGYDNSGKDDEEALEADFSDDEKEAEFKKQLKVKKRKGGNPQLPPDMAVAQEASKQGAGAPGAREAPRYGGGQSGRGNPRHAGQRPSRPHPGSQHGGYDQQQQPGRHQSAMPMFPASPYGPGQGAQPQGMFMPGMMPMQGMPMGGYPMQQPMYNMGPGQAYGYYPQQPMLGGPPQGFMPPGGLMGPMQGMMPPYQQQGHQQQQVYGQQQQQQQQHQQQQFGYGNQEQQGMPPPY